MLYTNYYWGMHWVWWFVWLILLLWIFAIPYKIPGQRYRKDSPLDALRMRFASGQITEEEYKQRRKILEDDIKNRH